MSRNLPEKNRSRSELFKERNRFKQITFRNNSKSEELFYFKDNGWRMQLCLGGNDIISTIKLLINEHFLNRDTLRGWDARFPICGALKWLATFTLWCLKDCWRKGMGMNSRFCHFMTKSVLVGEIHWWGDVIQGLWYW